MSKVDEFLDTLVVTNKTHEFFTNWQKTRGYQALYKDELALLGVLTGSDNPKVELKRLLLSYPRINSLIPLLSAIRIKGKPTLFVLEDDSTESIEYYFGTNGIDEAIADKTVDFTERSGLLNELSQIKNHSDYYFGIEVGFDTNGRKNRSGTAMETLVEPFIRDLAEKFDGQYLTQTNFADAARLFNVEPPKNQLNKRGDFMLIIKEKPYNIETNYFDGGGSKQEVVNSYISRSQDLAEAGWGFAVVTDGFGWRGNRPQVEYAYATITNIYNLSMCESKELESLFN